MKLITKILSTLLLLHCSVTYGQMVKYNFKRELKGISDQWHKIILPDEIFGKTQNDLRDIRIFGFTEKDERIETPYILNRAAENIFRKNVAFKTLNTSHNYGGYFFTFEVPTIEAINQIQLDFKQANFDWQVKLEGSQDQNAWLTISDNYRILSIKNSITDFQFTTLLFPSSKYRFFRLYIKSKEQPDLTFASVLQQEISEVTYENYPIKNIFKKENKESEQTEIEIELNMPLPVSYISLGVANSFDYYRPITVKYIADSTKTEKGWQYNYNTLTSGTLNSIEKNEFKFSSTTATRLKIFIDNQANQPLTIDSIQVKGYEHSLIARFTEAANYFLVYGNDEALLAHYDIERFTNNIPATLSAIEVCKEMLVAKDKGTKKEALFKDSRWLWIIIGFIILVLGFFTLKMMRKN